MPPINLLLFLSFVAARGVRKKENFSLFVVNSLLCESEILMY
jgi:hypothetical protein